MNTDEYSNIRNVLATTTNHHDFGKLDDRGRKIGAFVRAETAAYALAAKDTYARYRVPPGSVRYEMTPHATRDGDRYGALQATQVFETQAARDEAVAKYLAGARKRAEKTAAGGRRSR